MAIGAAMNGLHAQLKAARNAGVPLLAIETADPTATIRSVRDVFDGDAPLVVWDVARGFVGVNDRGAEVIDEARGDLEDTSNPMDALQIATKFVPDTVLFFVNAHRWCGADSFTQDIKGAAAITQAIWNLRDPYKNDGRILILLGPKFVLPPELAEDVVVFEEPLPDAAQLAAIVRRIHAAAEIEVEDATVARAVDALRGVPPYGAEQITALCLKKTGLDIDALWERKRKLVDQTPGLAVSRDPVTFDDIGGCENIKQFCGRVLAGKNAPTAVVWIDEIEKALAGAGRSAIDSSGVSKEMLGTILTYMQEQRTAGMIFVGPPGAAKSVLCKAIGNTAGVPTIQFNISDMKASLVGESQARLARGLAVVDAVSSGRPLFVATCNSLAELPPELKRRFRLGTFFFDLPDEDEQQKIWKIYAKKYAIGSKVLAAEQPECTGWTGAEIETCCDVSWRLNVSLGEAAKTIVPIAVQAATVIEDLRKQANGKFTSASYAGPYKYVNIWRGGEGRRVKAQGGNGDAVL
jgi:hypothetical protein